MLALCEESGGQRLAVGVRGGIDNGDTLGGQAQRAHARLDVGRVAQQKDPRDTLVAQDRGGPQHALITAFGQDDRAVEIGGFAAQSADEFHDLVSLCERGFIPR